MSASDPEILPDSFGLLNCRIVVVRRFERGCSVGVLTINKSSCLGEVGNEFGADEKSRKSPADL